MIENGPCPVCASPYSLFVQNVIGRRTGDKIKQFVCLDCRSFWNFSGYKEPDAQQKNDFEYVRTRQDHISALQGQLVLEIITRAPGIKTCCEIGYGTGLFLKACKNFGIAEYGLELNPYAAQYAKEIVGVNAECGLFTDEHTQRYDLIAAIGVFEHIERPRELFKIMAGHLNRDGVIYLSVPFVERHHWRFLWEADQHSADGPPDPFYDNDVHIIHYSIAGLIEMGKSIGARDAEYFVSKDVRMKSPGAYPGVLFRF